MTAPERAVVRLQRTFAAPPERVFRAWLDPDVLMRWMAPGSMRLTRAEVDARVGGRFRVWHSDANGAAVGGFDAEVLALVPNERIVFLWRFVGPDRVADPAHDSRLTVTFAAAPEGGTELTLVHERLEELTRDRPEIGRNVEGGWSSALDKLAGAAATL
jgi:uncharacterized protein YndB with AHSA1/START domain